MILPNTAKMKRVVMVENILRKTTFEKYLLLCAIIIQHYSMTSMNVR